jgi:hypothetical protein
MPLIAEFAATPNYVLMNGNRRIGPNVEPLASGVECVSIYGFSDKEPYDKFCLISELALTPYPLVKQYLRDQESSSGEGLNLVIIDAAGPKAFRIVAATMRAVLEAQSKQENFVNAEYQLIFDDEANAYRISESRVE